MKKQFLCIVVFPFFLSCSNSLHNPPGLPFEGDEGREQLCHDDYSVAWTDCVGTKIGKDGSKYVGEIRDGKKQIGGQVACLII